MTNDPIIVYGRPGCPGVPPVLHMLETAGLEYRYVDIRQDPEGAARLRAVANGNESVPTVVLPDGRALVETGAYKLRKALLEMEQPPQALESPVSAARAGIRNPMTIILIMMVLALIVTAVFLSM